MDDLADKLKVVLQELSDVMKQRKDKIEEIRNQITVLENMNEDLDRKISEIMRDF
jgi:chaperonin cofactor prefoldin